MQAYGQAGLTLGSSQGAIDLLAELPSIGFREIDFDKANFHTIKLRS
jgi:hypothetical protein